MRRLILAGGLWALLGCGGTENEEAGPQAAAAPITAGDEGVTPRVGRFAPLPANLVVRGGIEPEAWRAGGAPTTFPRPAIAEEGSEELGHFDPAALRAAEEHRFNARMVRGVR